MTDRGDRPVALVTGGGAGIGAAMARRLAGGGFRVVVADVDAGAAARVATEVDGHPYEVDVADLAANQAMVADTVARFGRLDLAVLNAGIAADQLPGQALDLARYRRLSGVNVDGVVFGVDAALPALAERGGTVLVTASLAGVSPELNNPLYALTKSAVVGFVRAVAATLAQRGVVINCVCPGFVDTAILGRRGRFLRRQGFPLLSPDDVAASMMDVLAAGGTGQVWLVLPGQAPVRHEFAAIPPARHPDGREAHLPDLAALRRPVA